jgi:hypothetical protein
MYSSCALSLRVTYRDNIFPWFRRMETYLATAWGDSVDIMSPLVIDFGQFTHLKTTFCQRCQKLVIQFIVYIFLFAGIIQFGRAFEGQFESGFCKISGHMGSKASLRVIVDPISVPLKGITDKMKQGNRYIFLTKGCLYCI